ncbi:MAG: hypothetical protein ACE5OR_07695 [bacterium]
MLKFPNDFMKGKRWKKYLNGPENIGKNKQMSTTADNTVFVIPPLSKPKFPTFVGTSQTPKLLGEMPFHDKKEVGL